jgi:hypothetical protein
MKLDGFHDCDKDEPWGRMKAREQKTGNKGKRYQGTEKAELLDFGTEKRTLGF